MMTINRMNCVFAALVCTFFATQLVFSQTNATSAVNSFISKQATEAGADEYSEGRKIVRSDVNGDGKIDLIVLYTLEGFGGGNSHAQYLAIFLGGGKTFKNAANVAVGGKLNRSVELTGVTAGRIDLDTLAYRSNDPACCPTRKGKTHYRFSQNRLKETK